MPVISYNFKKKNWKDLVKGLKMLFWSQKWVISHVLGIIGIFLKNPKLTFTQFLMSVIIYNFRKDFRSHLPNLKQKFSLKPQNSHICRFFNACHQVQVQKNLINKFWETSKNANFEPQIAWCIRFGHNKNFP